MLWLSEGPQDLAESVVDKRPLDSINSFLAVESLQLTKKND